MDDFFEGEGTELSPYEVSTWYHMNLLRNPIMLNKSFVQTNNINLNVLPYTYNDRWDPIGSINEPFAGYYDGNGYVISNLQRVSGTPGNSGLFGVVKNATFIDVSLNNFNVSGQENVGTLAGLSIDTHTKNASVSNSAVSGSKNIGGLYGKVERKNVFADNSAIKGVTVENTSVTGSYSDKENIGGVIGYCSIDVSNPNYNYNPIYIRLNDIVVDGITLKGTKNVGGAIGYAYNTYIIGNGTLDHSIAASSIEIEGQENVGGVIGYYQTRSRNLPSSPSLGVTLADISVSDASIEATSANNVGGAIGHVNNADIKKCVITDLSIEINNSENIGGLIGYQFGSIITYCSVEGGIVGEASENIGGLIGYGKNNRGSSYNIEDSSTHIEIGIFGDSSNIGGLMGLGYKGEVNKCSSQGSIYRTHNIGTVNNVGGLIGTGTYSFGLKECFAATHIKANHRLGGLVGNLTDTASDTFTSIIDCYATGNIEGKTNVGGLVGYLGCRSEVSNSYSIGKVTGSSNVGGLVGNSDGGGNKIENSYWDIVTSYKNVSLNGDIGEGLMTVDMVRDNSEYTDWNFYNVWAMEDYTTYPYLQWQDGPGVHNYPKHGHHKVYKGRTVYWESFPVLLYNGIDFAEVLEPLTNIEALSTVYAQSDVTRVWEDTQWSGILDFVKTGGYKLEFVDDEEYELIVPGTAINYDNTTVTLSPEPYVNWVGYWIPQPQHVSDVFNDPAFDYVKEVRGEGWAISRSESGGSWGFSVTKKSYMSYGKMYEIVTFSDDDEEFSWPLPTAPYYPPADPTYPVDPKATPSIFSFKDGPDYEVFNIESIDNDQDVIEVGVFAGDTCVGASVFTGEYPLQILAYTNASHSEEVISFVVHRSARGEDSNVRTVELLDPETGEYYEEVLQPQAKRIAALRLGAGDEIEEREEVVKPQFTLSQNYPNPILMGQVSRSSELTKIDFSLPEAAEVSLNVYNIKGQLVKTLASGELSAGRHTVSWDGNNVNNQSVGSGVYFYRLDNGKKTINRKMLIVK